MCFLEWKTKQNNKRKGGGWVSVKVRTLRELWGVKQVSSQQASFSGDFCNICCFLSTVHATPLLIVTSIYTAMGETSKKNQDEESCVLTENFPDAARQLVELGPCPGAVLVLSLLLSRQCWVQVSLKSQLPMWWECVEFGESSDRSD